jgi:hypothetical protein
MPTPSTVEHEGVFKAAPEIEQSVLAAFDIGNTKRCYSFFMPTKPSGLSRAGLSHRYESLKISN